MAGRTPSRLPTISPRAFQLLAAFTVGSYALLVVTGGAVRLTGSGLGCLDWPTCSKSDFIASASFHPLVEFSNRLVTVAVTVISLAVFLGALRRVPRRRDLTWLAAGIVAGLGAQVVLGGLVVLFKLNPYLVALHFVLTFTVLAVALALWHRGRLPEGAHAPVVAPEIRWLARILLVVLSAVVLAGTVVTGSGPHAGAPGTSRIAFAFRDAAELHATLALFLIGLTLATLFALHVARAPAEVQRRARILLEVMFVQGALGYSQYFLHDAAAVVEVHLAGATSVWCNAVYYYLLLSRPIASPLSSLEAAGAGDDHATPTVLEPGMAALRSTATPGLDDALA
jgi:cytochrome c oxidase assembly protein subunit 15